MSMIPPKIFLDQSLTSNNEHLSVKTNSHSSSLVRINVTSETSNVALLKTTITMAVPMVKLRVKLRVKARVRARAPRVNAKVKINVRDSNLTPTAMADLISQAADEVVVKVAANEVVGRVLLPRNLLFTFDTSVFIL